MLVFELAFRFHFTPCTGLLKSIQSIGSVSSLRILFICLQGEPIRSIGESLFLYCKVNFLFTAAIVLAAWSLQYLNYKINKINFFFCLFLNIWNYNLSLNGTYCQIWCLLFLRKMLHQIYCNLLFSITCYSNGWKNNFTLALKLTYMLGFNIPIVF